MPPCPKFVSYMTEKWHTPPPIYKCNGLSFCQILVQWYLYCIIQNPTIRRQIQANTQTQYNIMLLGLKFLNVMKYQKEVPTDRDI